MTRFRDRHHAGQELAKQVNYSDGILLALPRGGVPVAYEVAKVTGLPLDITCPRKIGAPGNPEYALGAITESGEGVFSSSVDLDDPYIQKTIGLETEEAKKRLKLYRGNRPPRDLKGKRVILIDDGLATGSTMKAAIKSVKAEGASQVIVAVPVAPVSTAAAMRELVDELIILDTPEGFFAVGQFYDEFSQTTDEEVIEFLNSSLANPE